MDPSSSFASGSNGRQKRVLPSRTRRGGPGVGSCDTDVMILEYQKRRFETEAIIPPSTPFLLTTNSEVFFSAGGLAEPSVTTVTNERYFDRPDVLKAYREQLTIQTPSFAYVADNPSVGGRFRPRGPEDAQIDTSDVAYERKHRKYETFEKRQRLREKEKLKHEQYKLKERIEQLRVMDTSAFLALPASDFSPAPGNSEDSVEDGISNLSIANADGTPAFNEGERRRKEMLDIALALQDRYRVLLPSEKLRRLQSQPVAAREHATPIPVPSPLSAYPHDVAESEREEEEVYVDGQYDRRQERLRIKLKLGGSASQSPAPTTASRTSKMSARASVPPGQKPRTRRRSRAYAPSRSPTPPTSLTKLPDSSQPITYTNSEPPSPDLRPQESEESEEEYVPPSSAQRSVVNSHHKVEVDVGSTVPRPSSRGHTLPPLTPPQKLDPLPDTHLAPAPEVERRTRGSPNADQGPLPAPASRHYRPVTSRYAEGGSRLLELANAVQSIGAMAPPAKRQKVRQQEPSKTRGYIIPPPHLAVGSEREANGEHIGSPSPSPSAPMSISAGPSRPSPSPSAPPTSVSAYIPASASISTTPTRRRYKKKTVSFRSVDTGQTVYTRSLLLIAGVRGSQRQTQRHQMAFGVKVPEEISDVRDFELPAEFWPEEELMKYFNYGLEAPGPQEQDNEEGTSGMADGEYAESPTGE